MYRNFSNSKKLCHQLLRGVLIIASWSVSSYAQQQDIINQICESGQKWSSQPPTGNSWSISNTLSSPLSLFPSWGESGSSSSHGVTPQSSSSSSSGLPSSSPLSLFPSWSESGPSSSHGVTPQSSSSSSSRSPYQLDGMTLIPEAWVRSYPYNAIVSLEVTFNGGKGTGTGFFVGNDAEANKSYILTAAHVIFDKTFDWATQIQCHINRHGSGERSIYVHKYAVPASYKEVWDGAKREISALLQQSGVVNDKEKKKILKKAKVKGSAYDYALLYLDGCIRNSGWIKYIPNELQLSWFERPEKPLEDWFSSSIGHKKRDDDQALLPYDQANLVFSGYPYLTYRFLESTQLSSLKKTLRECETIHLMIEDDLIKFSCTTLDRKVVKEPLNFMSPIIKRLITKNQLEETLAPQQEDIVNKPLREQLLTQIHDQIKKDGQKFLAMGQIPYEIKASFCGDGELPQSFFPYRLWVNKDDIILFKTPSYKGMSGCPIRFSIRQPINLDDRQLDLSSQLPHIWHAIAVLSQGNDTYTLGCRLTTKKIKNIEEWKRLIPNIVVQNDFDHVSEAFFKDLKQERMKPTIIIQGQRIFSTLSAFLFTSSSSESKES